MPTPEYIVAAPPAGDIPFVIPLGLTDLVSRLGRSGRGFYFNELDDGASREVGVVVLPVHWYYSLAPAIDLACKLKKINPKIQIVSGGYTAGAFPELLLEKSEIDWIIRGDSEGPFVDLMECLLDGRDPHHVPNLMWRGGKNDLDYQVKEEILAGSNNRDLSWFPSFEKAALASQMQTVPSFLFPWVPVSRGCSFDCPDCFASKTAQRHLAGRAMVRRPPEAVREDLGYWSKRPDIRWCYFNSDFISTMGSAWADKALDGDFGLHAYYEWYRVPEPAEMQKVIRSFTDTTFGLFLRPDGECAQPEQARRHPDLAKLQQAVSYCKNKAHVLLYITPRLAADNPSYSRDAIRIKHSGSTEFKLFDEVLVSPIPEDNPQERREHFTYLVSESRENIRRLALQHRILGHAICKAPWLYFLLWKISGIRLGVQLRLIRLWSRCKAVTGLKTS